MDIESSIKNTNKPTAGDDFITRMQKNIIQANKNKPKSISHLGEVVGI